MAQVIVRRFVNPVTHVKSIESSDKETSRHIARNRPSVNVIRRKSVSTRIVTNNLLCIIQLTKKKHHRTRHSDPTDPVKKTSHPQRSLSQVNPTNEVLTTSSPIRSKKNSSDENTEQQSVGGIQATYGSTLNSETGIILGNSLSSVSYKNRISFYFSM